MLYRTRRLFKVIIRKIFGHKYDCDDCKITKRCVRCPMYLTAKETEKVLETIRKGGY